MAAQNFDRACALIFHEEGGYVNHPKDPGGPTNLGLTLATMRDAHIDVDGDGDVDAEDVKKLTPRHAKPVYRVRYWNAVHADELPSGLDLALFDCAVNMGPARARDFLQIAVAVKRDGIIGEETKDAVLSRMPNAIICALEMLRKNRYHASPNFGVFGKGWLKRLDEVTTEALKWANA